MKYSTLKWLVIVPLIFASKILFSQSYKSIADKVMESGVYDSINERYVKNITTTERFSKSDGSYEATNTRNQIIVYDNGNKTFEKEDDVLYITSISSIVYHERMGKAREVKKIKFLYNLNKDGSSCEWTSEGCELPKTEQEEHLNNQLATINAKL